MLFRRRVNNPVAAGLFIHGPPNFFRLSFGTRRLPAFRNLNFILFRMYGGTADLPYAKKFWRLSICARRRLMRMVHNSTNAASRNPPTDRVSATRGDPRRVSPKRFILLDRPIFSPGPKMSRSESAEGRVEPDENPAPGNPKMHWLSVARSRARGAAGADRESRSVLVRSLNPCSISGSVNSVRVFRTGRLLPKAPLLERDRRAPTRLYPCLGLTRADFSDHLRILCKRETSYSVR